MTDASTPSADEVADLARRLFDAARAGDTEMLSGYIDAGVPVDLAAASGDTLIMLAAYHGHVATVSALLARGANPNHPNDKGQTPLAGAVFKGFEEVIDALVAGGADPDGGQPSARAAAQMFERTDLLARLDRR
ncbi:MAG: ankyrin repeat domain-containing protein [Aquihabitans sp.]